MKDITAFQTPHFERFQGPTVMDGNNIISNDVGTFLGSVQFETFGGKTSETIGASKKTGFSIINGQRASNNDDNDYNLT